MPLLAMAPGPFVLPLGGDEALVEAIAPLTAAFEIWRGSKIVSNLMGTGPVPSFAPPYVPVGPVVGGVANGIPGSIQ